MSAKRAVKICGLGAVPTEDATLEALQALGSCGVVFTDLSDPETLAWLGRLCPLKTTASAAEVLEGGAGTAGLAVWGHPLINSALARDVLAGARAADCAVELFAGISPLGAWLARDVAFLGGEEGVKGGQACALQTALERPALLDSPVPLLLYAERGGDWKRLAAALTKLGRKDLKVGLYALPAFLKKTVTPAELAAAAPPSAVVLVPPRGPHAS